MKTSRAGKLIGLVLGLIVLVSVPGVALADDPIPTEIDITVAPSTLNLSYQGPCVTVHTNLAYTTELEANYVWTLQGVESYAVFPDDCGDLVAKFDVDDIATDLGRLTEPTAVTMTLTGVGNEVSYAGSDEVRVIDVTGPKNGK